MREEYRTIKTERYPISCKSYIPDIKSNGVIIGVHGFAGDKESSVLRSLAAFLDYDGNGTISDDDAIMMYNFIVLGGIDDPDSMYEEDIIQGVSGEVDAATALANFKAYAKKN